MPRPYPASLYKILRGSSRKYDYDDTNHNSSGKNGGSSVLPAMAGVGEEGPALMEPDTQLNPTTAVGADSPPSEITIVLDSGIVPGSPQWSDRPRHAASTRFRFDGGVRQNEKSLAAGEALKACSRLLRAGWMTGVKPPVTKKRGCLCSTGCNGRVGMWRVTVHSQMRASD